MKKLKRLLLIHWHHYEKEIINFEDINFLTGKTATGKSTIIDALQLVLLGDTSGHFFNKAANDKSTRTLKSYLFCEEGDDGDAGFRYLRKQRFTSYVAVEFEDTEKNTHFSCGLVCDCYTDGSFDSKWFMLRNSGFPENLFIDPKTNIPYTISGLKAYLQNKTGKKKGDFDFYENGKSYQVATLFKFGQVKPKYRTLLRKAVPFTPITDIEQFITESICDVRNNIDVEKMQSDIRHYKNLEDDAAITRSRIEFLEKIDASNKEYCRFQEVYKGQSYVIARANVDEKEQEKLKQQELLEQVLDELQGCEGRIQQLTKELQDISELRGDKEAEYRNSDVVAKEKRLKEELAKLEELLEAIKDGIIQAVINLQNYGKQWKNALKLPELAKLEGLAEAVTYIEGLERLNTRKIVDLDFDKCLEIFELVKEKVQGYALELQKRLEKLQEDIAELELWITNLKKGIKPYPEKVVALKRLLEKEVFKRYNKAVTVFPLAELLEIKNPQWQNAVEGYLANQKFYLILPEAYYDFALKVYDTAKKELGLYDVGLINIAALKKYYHGEVVRNSLAEEVESENQDALLYAKFILGKVVKCASVEELSRYKVAITASGMLYKNFVSRRINPKLYENPFIGRRSMERQLAFYQRALDGQLQEQKQDLQMYNVVSKCAKYPILSAYEADSYSLAVTKTKNIPSIEKQRKALVQELDSLDLTYLSRLKLEIEGLRKQEYELTLDKNKLLEKTGGLKEQVRNIKEVILPSILNALTLALQEIADRYDEAWISTVGNAKYRDALKESRVSLSIKASYESAIKGTQSSILKWRNSLVNLRGDYNRIYKTPFDVSKEDNRDFDNELSGLRDIRLPDFIAKIKDAKEKAYIQFKDDFIAKLKSNIETVRQQIDELNASLRQSVFGTDKYHFVMKPRAEYQQYYDMITDPMLLDTGGWNLTSEAFNVKYQKEINSLFDMLILNETDVNAAKREEYEKAIRRFTDYKTYLVFDLIVTNEQGIEQRLSKTILKKSGGETQIPFYIALLASFSQVCRIRSKNQNNTIRLIILDEAFSKMDGERIKESIPLLRRFGLQAIFSAPPDKIPDIAPLVDHNIAVYKNGDYSFTRSFDPKALEELEELAE